MKNIKTLVGMVAVVIISAQFAFGQSASFPKASDLKVPSDYPRYKDAVLRCIDWLETTPIDPNSQQRKDANKLILKWITGQSGIRMYMGPNTMDYVKGNPDLEVIFLGGIVKNSMTDPNEADKEKINLAGTREIIKVYKANTGIKKDSKMDNLVQMDNNNTLEKYLSQSAKSQLTTN